MKQLHLRILALLLIIATILPLATACKKDPPPNKEPGDDNETENEGEEPMNSFYIDAVQTGAQTLTVADFSSQEMKDTNPSVSNALTSRDGRGVLILEASKNTVAVKFPQSHEVYKNYYYINFSVYSAQESDTVINIKFDNMSDKNITLDYVGWKDFSIKLDFLSAKMPFPLMTGLTVSRVSGSSDAVAYVSNITAVRQIYTLSVPDGVSLDDPALYSAITDTYREYLVGSETPADSDAYRKKATSAINNAQNTWNQFKATSDKLDEPETLFNIKIFNIPQAGYGTPYKNGNQITAYYQKVAYMASGYGIPGSSLYKNPELLDDIIACLEYGYKFYYGEEIVTTSTTYGNWWEWRVGIPMALLNIITILKDDLTPEQISKYLAPLDVLMPIPWGAGANLLWMSRCVINSAALQGDAMRICVALEICADIFTYVEDYNGPETFADGGMHKDGSFIQHGALGYNIGYGVLMLSELSTALYCLKDSRFNLHGEKLNNQFKWIFDAYRPFLYDGIAMSCTRGRGVRDGSAESNFFGNLVISFIKMRQYAPNELKPELDALIRYLMDHSSVDFASSVAYPLMEYCTNLKADPTYANQEQYILAKVYGSMDRVVQHTQKYAVSLSLSSTRVMKYEAINGSNFTGWYMGDGMLHIYTDGYAYDKEFYWYSNPYLMPGTTVNLAPRKVTAINSGFYNSDPYAGGVQQGNYAAAGFILGYDLSNTYAAQTFNKQSDATITARKSYFFFDNEIVCLGSSINDFSGAEVRTVIENRHWKSSDVFSVNGASIAPATAETTISARTMHFTGMGGYVILDGSNVIYQKATNSSINSSSGTGTQNFLEISISHGKGDGNIENDRYSYVYLPEATVQETESYNQNPDVEILLRSDTTHAVLEKKLGIVGCVFFEDFGDGVTLTDCEDYTAVSGIEADTPCILMVSKGENGEYNISVSDPTQTYSNIKFYITIDGISEVVSADTGVSSSISGNTACVTVNCKGARGETFNLTIK